MLIGIISDVHSVHSSLENILDKLSDVDIILNLGDVVGYHGDVNRCVDLLADRRIINLLGGHDIEIFAKDLVRISERPFDYGVSADNKKLIKKYSLSRRCYIDNEKYTFMHGVLYRCNGSIIFDTVKESNAAELVRTTESKYVFVGHSHIPQLFTVYDDGTIKLDDIYEDNKLRLRDNSYIISVGAVANDNYAIMDTRKKEVFITCK